MTQIYRLFSSPVLQRPPSLVAFRGSDKSLCFHWECWGWLTRCHKLSSVLNKNCRALLTLFDVTLFHSEKKKKMSGHWEVMETLFANQGICPSFQFNVLLLKYNLSQIFSSHLALTLTKQGFWIYVPVILNWAKVKIGNKRNWNKPDIWKSR